MNRFNIIMNGYEIIIFTKRRKIVVKYLFGVENLLSWASRNS